MNTKISMQGSGHILFLICFLTSSLAHAVLLEEVVVTAQKREQSLQDVGISVSVMSGEQITALGLTNTIDITAQTPGLNFQQYSPTQTIMNIRGVSQNDFQDQHEPPVAGYVDGAYVSTMGAAHAQMFDMERVEVLRGPQGTLFGRNATGGLIHYITRKPEKEWNGYVELTFAEHDQIKSEGAIGGAITDAVSARVSFATNDHDGWTENRIGPDLNDADSKSVRGQLLFLPSDDIEILLKGHYSEIDTFGQGYDHSPATYGADGLGFLIGSNQVAPFFGPPPPPPAPPIPFVFVTCPGCDASGFAEPDDDPRTGSFNDPGFFEREIAGMTATIDWDINGMTLTSITDYLTMDKDYAADTDGGANTIVHAILFQELDQISQELRLQGQTDRLNWQAGFYYLDIDTDTINGGDPLDLSPFLGAPLGVAALFARSDVTLESESWAIFAHAEYALTDALTLIGAVRYTEDTKELDYDLLAGPAIVAEFQDKQEWENISARLQLDWQVNEDTLAYAGVTRGHKAGSFSLPFISFGPLDTSAIPHDEEVLTSYEVGLKTDFLDGRARLNASAFYYDYDDYQAASFVNLVLIIGNNDAEVYGGEIELVLNPIENLELLLGASFLDSTVEDVTIPGPFGTNVVTDRELPLSSDFTWNGLVRYTWPLGSGSLTAQMDANYVDDVCFSVVCHHSEREDGYLVGNARLSYTSAGDVWSAALFVRNLGDVDYRVYGLDASFVSFNASMPNPPRWFGGTIRYNWR